MKSNMTLFMAMLSLGTMISISSFSWFSMWLGLEINLLSFIPLMNESLKSSESALKYFITQVFASLLILFSMVLSLLTSEFLIMQEYPCSFIFNTALLIKIGAAPFHFWFPEVIEGLSWSNSLILLTWQKIAPLILLMYNFISIYFFSFFIICSMLISGLMNWNQTSMKKILAFSSINHLGWMMAAMMLSQSIWIFYLLIYFFITLTLGFYLKPFKIESVKDFINSWNSNKTMKLFFVLNLLSLGGLPPFLGFFPKWLILVSMMNFNFEFLSFLMIFLTLIMLFVYVKLTYTALIFKKKEKLYVFMEMNYFKLVFLSMFNILGLIIFTFMSNFY